MIRLDINGITIQLKSKECQYEKKWHSTVFRL